VEMLIDARHKLSAAVGKVNSQRGPLAFLMEGDPATEIVPAAEEWDTQMIVLGFHPQSLLEGVLVGSTTEAVTQKAKCPVLVVPESTRASFLDW
jgi:nucleotide-binding universal stress UspA family protein